MQFHFLSITDIKKEINDTVSIAFEIPESLQSEYAFIPGQYITLKTAINGEDIRRAYSICSAPHENELRVAIKQIPNGVFSTYANNKLKTGDKLEVMTPNGHFYSEYKSDNKKNYVGFVAGSGITPLLSIVKHVLHTESDSKFTLFYGNKEVDSIIFGKEIDALKNQYPNRFSIHFIFSQENHGMDLFYGRIDADKLAIWSKGLFQVSTTDEYFMCGPEAMTNDIRSYLDSKNVDSKKVHFELFNTSGTTDENTSTETTESVTANIKVIVDDEEYEFELGSDEKDILQAGVDAGLDLPFSCKGGVCSTCRAKVLEGEATMKLNYSLLDEEVEAGYILTCQAHPKSEKLVVSFDD
jgi:ring-1,2-phenylacetyl-CoA epoxidase subunit PaaE